MPIHPQKGLLTAALLAASYAERIKGLNAQVTEELINTFIQKESQFQSKAFIPSSVNPVVIGFAETATALGHAFLIALKVQSFFTRREKR